MVEFEVSRPHRQLTIDVRARVSTRPAADPPQATWDALDDPTYREAGGEFRLQTDDAPEPPAMAELLAITLDNPSPMSLNGLTIRPGGEADGRAVVTLFDEAVAWLVERGQTGQWGATPFSERPGVRERVHGFRIAGGLHLAELDGEPVGVLVVGPAPAYAPPVPVPDLYIILLLSSRRLMRQGIGSELVNRAIELGYERGAEVLRVDCWAHAPGLVRWYEKQGFSRSSRFELNGWQGQIFTMPL